MAAAAGVPADGAAPEEAGAVAAAGGAFVAAGLGASVGLAAAGAVVAVGALLLPVVQAASRLAPPAAINPSTARRVKPPRRPTSVEADCVIGLCSPWGGRTGPRPVRLVQKASVR